MKYGGGSAHTSSKLRLVCAESSLASFRHYTPTVGSAHGRIYRIKVRALSALIRHSSYSPNFHPPGQIGLFLFLVSFADALQVTKVMDAEQLPA